MARFRASANIVWDFEDTGALAHTSAALEKANAYLSEVFSDLPFAIAAVQVDKLKDKVQKVQLGEFKLEEVIPFVKKSIKQKEYECNGVKYVVKMNSHRYYLFRDSTCCVACGLKGTKMFLEYHPADKSPHFNLYGEEDGKLILMTKDHIRAKAFGGEDRMSNYQIMCLTCNNLKSHSNINLDGVRTLREIYNENKDKLSKKQLHSLIEETRTKIQKPWDQPKKKIKKKSPVDFVTTNCDIFIYEENEHLVGKSIFDDIENKIVGCIKKGVCLEPLLITKEKIMCKIPESNDAILLHQSLVIHKEKQ